MDRLKKESEVVDYFPEDGSILEKIDSCKKCGFSVNFGIDTTSIELNRLVDSYNKSLDVEEREELMDDIRMYSEYFRTILIWTVEKEDDLAFCVCPNCKFENVYQGVEQVYEVEDITLDDMKHNYISELLPENLTVEWGEDFSTTEGQGE